jgi:hypothetical protein
MRCSGLIVALSVLLAIICLASSCNLVMNPAQINLGQIAVRNYFSGPETTSSNENNKDHNPGIPGGFVSASSNSTTRYYGDANEDFALDMGDIVTVERIILGLHSFTACADANCDKAINMGDVIAIERILLGLASAIPIEPSAPVIKSLSITDADLPAPPVSGMVFHFITSAPGEPGPGKIRATYAFFNYYIWFGVDHNQLWVFNLPKRESLPSSLTGFYDSLGINQYSVYDEQSGKYWFNEIPAWINISKYDPALTLIPILVSATSVEGHAQISYNSGP